jgi:hypothetical protein
MSRIATVVLIAAAVALPLSADAQFTIKLGASLASTTESELVPDVETRTGVAAGVGFGFQLGDGRFALHPELLYVQKGGKFGDAGTLKISELDVPLLLQFNVPIDLLNPYVHAGPQAEFELNCKTAGDDCVDTESVRWGAVLGLGARLGGLVSVEARYNWTFNEISDELGSKPRTILLLLGLDF